MPAQYAKLDGRHWVNEEFVDQVRQLYPATTRKIPLGYSTYTGWTGKDEILFTAHDHLDDIAHFEGQLFEASFDDVGAQNFRDKILDQIKHTEPAKAPRNASQRKRKIKEASLEQRWGMTLEEKMRMKVAAEKEARRGSGLYGYPKAIQASCESAIKKINRRAAKLMHKAVKKDRYLIPFLETHASYGQSSAARVLLAAYKASMPQTSWEDERDAEEESAEFDFGIVTASVDKEAAPRWGMYGFPRRTASTGLSACTAIREAAGYAAADLHRRKAAYYARVTGFLGEHNKVGKCYASGLILSCYPQEGFKFRMAAEDAPKTVAAWLDWDPDEG